VNIREALQEKTRRIMRLGLVAWLALVVSLIVSAPAVVHLLCFTLFFAAALAQSLFVRCPRCSGNVGLLVAQTLAPGRLKTQVTNCPFCAVSFEDHA
jgi:hypothetical protein